MSIHELERNLIPLDHWDKDPTWRNVVPEDIQKELLSDSPTAAWGLGHDEVIGWYVMATQGQGGGLVWQEKGPGRRERDSSKETAQELWSLAAGQWESARKSWMNVRHTQKPSDRDLAMAYEAYARGLECRARVKEEKL